MRRARPWAALGLASACAWHLALRWRGLGLPLTSDEGVYAYAARVWTSGGLPYRDAYLQKPPNIVLLYRLALALSDWPQAPRLLAVAFSWGIIVLLFAAAPRRWTLAARLAPAAVFAALGTLPIGGYGFAANTEIFMAAFSACGFFCLVRHWGSGRGLAWAAGCGLAMGAALATKQTALLTLAAFGALASWRGGRFDRRALAVFIAGAALVPALWGAYFLSRGGLDVLVEQAWRRNLLYAAVFSDPADIAARLRWFAKALLPGFALASAPAGVVAFYGCWRTGFSRESLPEAAAAAWLATALASAAIGYFFFPHYFLPAAPPLAMLCGLGIESLARRRPRVRWGWLVAALAAWPGAVNAALYFNTPAPMLAKKLLYPNPLVESLPIADFVASRTSPDDRIYVYGSEAQIYVYARRRCATEHEVVYSLTTFPRDRADIDGELDKLRRSRPKVVVYSAQPQSAFIRSQLGLDFSDEIRKWLAKDYALIGRVDVGFERSRYAFDAGALGGGVPDWNAKDSLFVFERR